MSGAPVEKEVVDTTGAGDAFVGSLAFFLACRCLRCHILCHLCRLLYHLSHLSLSLITKAKPAS